MRNEIRLIRRLTALFAAVICMTGLLTLNTAHAQVLPPDEGKTTDENWNTFGAESGPKLTLEADKLELGTITDNEKEKRIVHFRNTGTGLLTIEKVNTSCGCTVAELEVKDYLPGESGEIEITYDPTGRKGKQRKVITVISNDRDNRLSQIVLTVDIKPIITVDQAIVTAGTVIYGQGAQVRVVFSNNWAYFKPKSVSLVGANVSASIEKVDEVKLPDGRTDHRVTVLIKVDEKAPVGYVRRTLDFLAEVGDGENPPFDQAASTRININVVGDIEARPARLSMGRLNASQEFDREILLISRTNSPFEVTKVEFSRPIEGEVELSYEKDKDEDGRLVYRVHIKGVAPTKPGIVNGAVQITTNLKEQEAIDVSLVGSVTRPRR